MPPKSYNFFGLGPGQMDASQSAPVLAQQMALQEYNNPTSSQTQPSQSGGMGAINPQALAKMMIGKQSLTPSGIPSDSISWNAGSGALPWLPQNALPWSGGNG